MSYSETIVQGACAARRGRPAPCARDAMPAMTEALSRWRADDTDTNNPADAAALAAYAAAMSQVRRVGLLCCVFVHLCSVVCWRAMHSSEIEVIANLCSCSMFVFCFVAFRRATGLTSPK